MDMREQKFGIEIELTGLTRQKAAEVIGKYLGKGRWYGNRGNLSGIHSHYR